MGISYLGSFESFWSIFRTINSLFWNLVLQIYYADFDLSLICYLNDDVDFLEALC